MPYAILRTKKLKAITGVLGSGRHTFREMPTPNSDGTPSMHMAGATRSVELGRAVLARLPQKRRKGAVICIEYLITASPEAFARHGGALPDTGIYFDRALAWLKARHGSANVVCAEVHLDERTPHLVAYVAPLTRDGRLSARDFLGGPAKLRKMQTEFHHWCGKPFGLSRGVEGARASHQKIEHYYQALATPEPTIDRADLVAAVVGIQTPNYKALLQGARAASTLALLQQAATQSLHDREIALGRQAHELLRAHQALEELELSAEKRIDRLDEVDRELESALFAAGREKKRADDLARNFSTLTSKINSRNDQGVGVTI